MGLHAADPFKVPVHADPELLTWYYVDRTGAEFGPFRSRKMRDWFSQGFFPMGSRLLVRLETWKEHLPISSLFPGSEPFAGLPLLPGRRGPPPGHNGGHPQERGHASGGYPYDRGPPESGGHPHDGGYYRGPPLRGHSRSPPAPDRGRDRRRGRSRSRSPPYRYPIPESGVQGGNHRGHSDAVAPPPGYSLQPAQYPAPAYPPLPAYGTPPSGYGPPAPAYGAPPSGYQPNYAAPAPPPQHGRPPAYGHPPPGHPPPGYPPHGHQPHGHLPPPPGYGPPQPGYWPPLSAPYVDPNRFVGRIKSFSSKNGFGFIDCPPAYDRWRRDVFIHHEWMSDLKVGDDIVFVVETNKDGMPQARDVVRFDGTPVGRQRGNRGDGERATKKRAAIEDAPAQAGKPPSKMKKPQQCTVPEELRTTVMVRNIPNSVARTDFTMILDSKGFATLYDFVYLPTSFRTWKSMGYAFVNMTAPEHARRLMQEFQGFDGWEDGSADKTLDLHWSTLQGLQQHLERYKNSPVMHSDVPDEYRPLHLNAGCPVPLPQPTKTLKAPRLRPRASGSVDRAIKDREQDEDGQEDCEAPDHGDEDGAPT